MSLRAVAGSALVAVLVVVSLTGCAAPEPTPKETVAEVPPSPEPAVEPVSAADAEPVDAGEIEGAMGKPVVYQDELVGYEVTYGDVIGAIERRFGVIGLADLNRVDETSIAPGDRLVLREGAVMPDISGCVERSKLGFLYGEGDGGHRVFWIGPELTDRGATDTADGIVTKDSVGRIVSYTVAEGDGEFAIGDRFCLEPYSFLEYNELEWPIEPGDVISLVVDPADLFVAKQ